MDHFSSQRFENENQHEVHVPILSNLVGWLRGPVVPHAHHHPQQQHSFAKADPLQITVQPTSATAAAAPAQQAGGMQRSKSAAFNMSSLGLGGGGGGTGDLPAQSALKQRSQSHHQDPLQGSFSFSSFLPHPQSPSPSPMGGPRLAPSSGSSQHHLDASPHSSAPNSRGHSPQREKHAHGAASGLPTHPQPHHAHRPCAFKL